jgi:RNA polymerase sigma-70 factor (ECF subfamily)
MKQEKQNIDEFRHMLFSIAYNMLGTVADAEDMVQETYISWLNSDKSHVDNIKFYLIRTVSNKCIAHLKKLKKERETYKGTWLPEPILAAPETESDPKTEDKLSIGFMYLLEKLSPIERGVMILKEAFNIDHSQISEIFDISYENSRQHFSRAKKKLAIEKTRFKVNTSNHEHILREFLEACVSNQPKRLIELLREDVIVYSDGGGSFKGVLKPIFGKEKVSRLFANGLDQLARFARMEILSVNGLSGAALYQISNKNTPDVLIAIDTDENGKIYNVYFMANPKKIKPIAVNWKPSD